MKFHIEDTAVPNKITETFALWVNFSFGDCEDSRESIIYIPKEKMCCKFLQHGLKILYTTLYSNTNYRRNQTPYYHVKGFDWIAGADGYFVWDPDEDYEPSITCEECPKNDHYRLDIDFPNISSNHSTYYNLTGISWRYYDTDGFIKNVNVEFNQGDIQDICEMIRAAGERYSTNEPTACFTSLIGLYYRSATDPLEFLDASKEFWPKSVKN